MRTAFRLFFSTSSDTERKSRAFSSPSSPNHDWVAGDAVSKYCLTAVSALFKSFTYTSPLCWSRAVRASSRRSLKFSLTKYTCSGAISIASLFSKRRTSTMPLSAATVFCQAFSHQERFAAGAAAGWGFCPGFNVPSTISGSPATAASKRSRRRDTAVTSR